jgi:hypothetical protein
LLSKKSSDVPSLFVENNEPMTLERIQLHLARGGVRDKDVIARAITSCCRLDLMRLTPEYGYELTRWHRTQTNVLGQQDSIRNGKQRLRARYKQRAPSEKNVRHLDVGSGRK